jgi:hypothetical protein
LVRPERFELPTLWFEAKCSIQLSYGRTIRKSETTARSFYRSARPELHRFEPIAYATEA